MAAKHGIHVPSLVADSLVTEEEEGLILDEGIDLDDTVQVPLPTLGTTPAGGGA